LKLTNKESWLQRATQYLKSHGGAGTLDEFAQVVNIAKEDRPQVRYILRNYGKDAGIFFSGKSRGDWLWSDGVVQKVRSDLMGRKEPASAKDVAAEVKLGVDVVSVVVEQMRRDGELAKKSEKEVFYSGPAILNTDKIAEESSIYITEIFERCTRQTDRPVHVGLLLQWIKKDLYTAEQQENIYLDEYLRLMASQPEWCWKISRKKTLFFRSDVQCPYADLDDICRDAVSNCKKDEERVAYVLERVESSREAVIAGLARFEDAGR